MTVDCIEGLPHHCLYITHNAHVADYRSMNDYLNEDYIKKFLSYEEAQKCIASDSIWEVQVYPLTPIGFYKTVASTLSGALELMKENYKGGKWV